MGLISSLFETRSGESYHPRDPALVELFGYGTRSIAGPQITESNALSIGAVWACIDIISSNLGSLPFLPYRRLDRGRQVATDHPLYRVLHVKTNRVGMTPMDFRQTITAHVLTWGNGFAEIQRNNSGAVTDLWPLLPDHMRLQHYNSKLYYYVRDDVGQERQLPAERVLHLRGLGNDGLIGYSVISKHRETLGLTKAEEEYRARFFSNDGRPGGVLEHPGSLSDPAFKHLKESWAEAHSGLGNKHKPAILEEGMKWHDVGMNAKDAEFIQGRKFQLQEVARIFRVPLVLLQEHENSTSWGSGVEQQFIGFVVHCLRHWTERWEQQCNIAFLTDSEQGQYYFKHNLDAMLRGDFKSRQEALRILHQEGVINADEWRELLDMNPIASGRGADYWRPANFVTADAVEQQQ